MISKLKYRPYALFLTLSNIQKILEDKEQEFVALSTENQVLLLLNLLDVLGLVGAMGVICDLLDLVKIQ